MANSMVRAAFTPAHSQAHHPHPAQTNRARRAGAIHGLVSPLAASRAADAAHRRGGCPRCAPQTGRFRSSRHRVGTQPPPAARRQLRSPRTRHALHGRRRRLGAHLAPPRRFTPTSMAPITFFLREDAHWMDGCLRTRELPESALAACLSPLALRVRASLEQAGAAFAADLARQLATPIAELHNALWELVAAGLVTADGYDSLRALIDPRRKSASTTPFRMRGSNQRARNTAGRWSLLAPPVPQIPLTDSREAKEQSAIAAAKQREQEIDSAALVLLWRYGIVFRDLLERETTMPRWRELLGMLRRLVARGIVRGGRLVSGFQGEQFALGQAVESLREMRKQ